MMPQDMPDSPFEAAEAGHGSASSTEQGLSSRIGHRIDVVVPGFEAPVPVRFARAGDPSLWWPAGAGVSA